MSTITHIETVPGNLKAQETSLVLELSSISNPTSAASALSEKPVLVNGTLVPPTKRRYACTFNGCDKSYTKPCRLAEHERSHTGERPFLCDTCRRSYLRESHLRAHARCHLPEASRPLACPRDGCNKRFWTSQHLRVHMSWHDESRPFCCLEDGCSEAFAKNYQLRTHVCNVHSTPGSKPYKCEYQDCEKTFSTKQHLRTHFKTHNASRYTCAQPECLPSPNNEPVYFPTWTALQSHIRTNHPPKCFNPGCNGRTFSSQKGLSAHRKIHELDFSQEIIFYTSENDASDFFDEASRKRRRCEIGRDWKCNVEGCDKEFKSKRTLTTHHNVSHVGKRDYACPEESCGRAFGYKHLLQRHLVKAHKPTEAPHPQSLRIDVFTGQAYARRVQEKIATAEALRCPYPDMDGISLEPLANSVVVTQIKQPASVPEPRCQFAFSRAYDLRRHLRSVHGLNADKDCLDSWVKWGKKVVFCR